MGELLLGKVTAYPKEDKQKGLVEVTVGAFDTDHATVLARVEPLVPGVYWLPELGNVVAAEIPDGPGYEAHVVHVRRQEGDAQTSSCWTEKNDIKQVKTRSGHTFTFDDTQDAAAVTLCSSGGLTLRLDDKAKTVTVKGSGDTPSLTLNMDQDTATLSAGQSLSLQCGGAEVKIDDQGNISISTSGNLSVSAKDITLSASASLTAEGQETKISGGATATVSGETKLDLKSSGITQINGSMVKLN